MGSGGLGRTAALILALGGAGAVAACDDDPSSLQRPSTRKPESSIEAKEARALELFRALEPDLQRVCGNACHAQGTMPGGPALFLAGPDAYVSVKAFPGAVTKEIFASRLLAKGQHAGPALEGLYEPLRLSLVEWLDVEASLIIEKSLVTTPVVDIASGRAAIDLGALVPTIKGATLTFEATRTGSMLSLSKMMVRGADASAVRVVHPTFVIVNRGGEAPDRVDSFSNLDDRIPAAQEKALGPGQMFLFGVNEGDRLRITFEVLEPTTMPTIPGSTDKPCKALQTFIDSAKPRLMDSGCMECHNEGGQGNGAFDLSQIDKDDAAACAKALEKVNLADRGASVILQSPAGDRQHTGGKVGDPEQFSAAIRTWIDQE